MLKKVSRKSAEANDVRADDPTHAMERFTDGLRRVLAKPKHAGQKRKTLKISSSP